eukprot:scaffold3118_cov64-Cylindrotheca_fusiformis.AAC.20
MMCIRWSLNFHLAGVPSVEIFFNFNKIPFEAAWRKCPSVPTNAQPLLVTQIPKPPQPSHIAAAHR